MNMTDLSWYRDLAIVLYHCAHSDDEPKVTDSAIADAFGLTKGRISQILNQEAFGRSSAHELNVFWIGMILRAEIHGYDGAEPLALTALAERVQRVLSGEPIEPPAYLPDHSHSSEDPKSGGAPMLVAPAVIVTEGQTAAKSPQVKSPKPVRVKVPKPVPEPKPEPIPVVDEIRIDQWGRPQRPLNPDGSPNFNYPRQR